MAKHQDKRFFALDEEFGHGRSQSCLWASSHVLKSLDFTESHTHFADQVLPRFTGYVHTGVQEQPGVSFWGKKS